MRSHLYKLSIKAIALTNHLQLKEKSNIIMTPQIQQAIANIKTLCNSEQRQLLQILSENVNKSNHLEQQNKLFWQDTSLENLIEAQKVPIIEDIKNLAGDYWGEDTTDDFLTFLKEQRQSEVA